MGSASSKEQTMHSSEESNIHENDTLSTDMNTSEETYNETLSTDMNTSEETDNENETLSTDTNTSEETDNENETLSIDVNTSKETDTSKNVQFGDSEHNFETGSLANSRSMEKKELEEDHVCTCNKPRNFDSKLEVVDLESKLGHDGSFGDIESPTEIVDKIKDPASSASTNDFNPLEEEYPLSFSDLEASPGSSNIEENEEDNWTSKEQEYFSLTSNNNLQAHEEKFPSPDMNDCLPSSHSEEKNWDSEEEFDMELDSQSDSPEDSHDASEKSSESFDEYPGYKNYEQLKEELENCQPSPPKKLKL